MTDFFKMHGLGNDFVIIDQRDGAASLAPRAIVALADRHRGIGFDQIIHIKPPRTGATDVFLDMYNADGSFIEACGDAMRCVALLLMEESGREGCVIETVAGLLHCRRAAGGLISVDTGPPREVRALETEFGHGLPRGVQVNVGNPHIVFFVGDVMAVDLAAVGPPIENHPLFPNRTNVEIAQILGPDKIRMRVWERGAGITQACGTGACATLVAAATGGLSARRAEIVLDGGSLFIDWREGDDHLLMTGAAEHVFRGSFES